MIASLVETRPAAGIEDQPIPVGSAVANRRGHAQQGVLIHWATSVRTDYPGDPAHDQPG